MASQLSEVPVINSGVTYSIVGLVATAIFIAKLSQGPNLDAFPAMGSSSWVGSWWAGFRHLTNAQDIIQRGYEKYKPMPFKIAELGHWTVILSDRGHVEELARAPDSVLSASEAINDQIQIEHTLGPQVHRDPYHVTVVRSHLTRNLDALYPDIRDEIVTSFTEVLNLKGNEWKSVSALSAVEKVICRTSNRVFVGLPLCHNPDWIDLNIRFTIDAMKWGVIIKLFPKVMRRLVVRLLNVRQNVMHGLKFLGPMIEERQKYLDEYGTMWGDKPNDLLSWLMDEAEGAELTPEHLTTRMLVVNFAAIHTTSSSFTQALFYLAANPQYIQPLREEVEGVVEKDGWSKAALVKMHKVDSFLKECQRIEGMNLVGLLRKAVQDFTFSDGTFIPKGAFVAVASRSLHYDDHFYKNPEVFEPFRFVHTGEGDGGNGPKHRFTSTATEYLAFGHGRHACPGRFFVASELKSMLAHIVVTYDVKLEDDAMRPPSLHIGNLTAANPRAKVVFRNRVD